MNAPARLLAPLALMGFLACSAESGDGGKAGPPAARTAKDAVVALVSPNGSPEYVCSAEVIAARTILSAAHCFKGGNYDKTGWTFEVVIGDDVHHPANGDRRIRVASVILHPDYESNDLRADGSDADIALALVAEDLAVPALPWRGTPLPASLVGRAARYAGFGHVDVARKGVRHFESARLDAVSATAVTMSAPLRNPCHGDSGGPLLVTLDGVETIIGVGHLAYDECNGGADYTRTDLFADFLRANMR